MSIFVDAELKKLKFKYGFALFRSGRLLEYWEKKWKKRIITVSKRVNGVRWVVRVNGNDCFSVDTDEKLICEVKKMLEYLTDPCRVYDGSMTGT